MPSPSRPTRSRPIRWLGVALSVAFPGSGHAYVGRPGRGAVLVGAGFALLAGVVLLAVSLASEHGAITSGAIVLTALGFRVGVAVDAFQVSPGRRRGERTGMAVLYVLAFVALSLVLTVATRVWLVEAFKIPGASMMPTLLVGDHVFAEKVTLAGRGPARGEPWVFAFPEQPNQSFVKRVIAAPGDVLEIRGGHPWLNGWEVPHCHVGRATYRDEGSTHKGEVFVEYLEGRAYLVFVDDVATSPTQGPFRAKSGEYWVLGDNRNNSHDSRYWFGGMGGGVPHDAFRGRALSVWMGAYDLSRTGTSLLGVPVLPPEFSELAIELARCSREAPPRAVTVPPSRP